MMHEDMMTDEFLFFFSKDVVITYFQHNNAVTFYNNLDYYVSL